MSKFIIGADEVGYGCYAGPICVGAVRAPADWNLEGLNDSKKLSEKNLNIMSAKLVNLADKGEIYFSISERPNTEIDAIGLGKAQKNAYIEAIQNVWHDNASIIMDGILKLPSDQIDISKIKSVIKADTFVPTVMAASILAKVYRDKLMVKYHDTYPVYNFASNVGYGTEEHRIALHLHGPCPLHRYSYKPIKALMSNNQ